MSDGTSEDYYLPWISLCDTLRDLVPFVQFKKCDKRPRRSVTFSIVVTLLKVTLFLEYFSRFLSCRNGTKLCKGCHIENRTSFLKTFHSISMFSWFVVYFYFLWKVTVIGYFWKVTVNIWNKSIIIIIRVYLFHSNSKSRINVN